MDDAREQRFSERTVKVQLVRFLVALAFAWAAFFAFALGTVLESGGRYDPSLLLGLLVFFALPLTAAATGAVFLFSRLAYKRSFYALTSDALVVRTGFGRGGLVRLPYGEVCDMGSYSGPVMRPFGVNVFCVDWFEAREGRERLYGAVESMPAPQRWLSPMWWRLRLVPKDDPRRFPLQMHYLSFQRTADLACELVERKGRIMDLETGRMPDQRQKGRS